MDPSSSSAHDSSCHQVRGESSWWMLLTSADDQKLGAQPTGGRIGQVGSGGVGLTHSSIATVTDEHTLSEQEDLVRHRTVATGRLLFPP